MFLADTWVDYEVLDTGDGEKPILIKEPLKYEAIQVQTRNYKS